MWRILGGRADKVLEDFDLEKCKHLYEDYPAPMVVSSSSDNVSVRVTHKKHVNLYYPLPIG